MSKVNMQVKRDFDHPVDRVWGILGNFADLGWIPRGNPMPVTDYLATVRVEELGAGRCRVHWSATADAQGISSEQAAEILSGVYGQMLGWVADALAKG